MTADTTPIHARKTTDLRPDLPTSELPTPELPTSELTPAEVPNAAPGKLLTDAARRALAEAAARKAEQDRKAAELGAAVEINGRGGLEPVRYNDWEVKGIAYDF